MRNDGLENQINLYLRYILNKMCSYVGIKYVDISPYANPQSSVLTPDWYLKYKWTTEQENDFRRWFINYLYNNKRVRKLFGINGRNKYLIKSIVDSFIFNYGWAKLEKS